MLFFLSKSQNKLLKFWFFCISKIKKLQFCVRFGVRFCVRFGDGFGVRFCAVFRMFWKSVGVASGLNGSGSGCWFLWLGCRTPAWGLACSSAFLLGLFPHFAAASVGFFWVAYSRLWSTCTSWPFSTVNLYNAVDYYSPLNSTSSLWGCFRLRSIWRASIGSPTKCRWVTDSLDLC